mmetsp:Transcript_30772/g.59378  ORF Transcript_30772/g.59378 Transcript_30772/m.59378 type:complete len:242 (+) Transcript_30772:440-1165(+)
MRNFLLQKLFKHGAEGDDPHGSPPRAGVVRDEGHVHPGGLQHVEHFVQRGVQRHRLHGEERHHGQRRGVVRVEHDEVLDGEDAQHVGGPPGAVHGQARVPRLGDGGHRGVVQHRVLREEKRLLERDVAAPHALVHQAHRAADDEALVLAQLAPLHLQVHEHRELGAAEQRHVVLAQDVVQQQADGVRYGRADLHQELHKGGAGCSNLEAVLGSRRLRDDLPEDEHHRDGQHHRLKRADYLV